ncbi:MAG: helix-hairpin-helix domain-containing protein, partial [Verrucomicrobiota bacterium]
ELDESSLPSSEEAIGEAVAQAVPDKVPVVNMMGVDLNRVTAAEICRTIDKVGPKLAERIVHDRTRNGWYRDIYDLTRIDGIGRRTFKSITGEEWDDDLCGPRQTIKKIMGSSDLSDVKLLAERVGKLKTFDGCLVAHVDGYVLATSWDHPSNEGLAALSPQIFKKVEGYLQTLQLGNVDTFTFYMQKIPVTLANSLDIYVAAIHTPKSFNQKHVSFVRALAKEVQRSFELQRQVTVE